MQDNKVKIATDLLANLHDEVAAFEELRVVLEEERNALVELDVPAIHRCTATKERIAARHQHLEDERRKLADRFFLLDRGLKPGSRLSTVAAAAKACGADPDGGLETTRGRLSCLMDTVREMNGLNEQFVAHSLVVVEGAMSMMKRVAGRHAPDAPPGTYAASGRVRRGAKGRDDASVILATG